MCLYPFDVFLFVGCDRDDILLARYWLVVLCQWEYLCRLDHCCQELIVKLVLI